MNGKRGGGRRGSLAPGAHRLHEGTFKALFNTKHCVELLRRVASFPQPLTQTEPGRLRFNPGRDSSPHPQCLDCAPQNHKRALFCTSPRSAQENDSTEERLKILNYTDSFDMDRLEGSCWSSAARNELDAVSLPAALFLAP